MGFDPHCEMAIDNVFRLLRIPHPLRRAYAATIVAPFPKQQDVLQLPWPKPVESTLGVSPVLSHVYIHVMPVRIRPTILSGRAAQLILT
jgi:hypothetical protein